MLEPLVSIIMGAYNAETTLENCINSILNQTYKNWEFIICNDCSLDQTKEIISDYTKKDNRIMAINSREHLLLAASLNKCLEHARGKYIARMDADDESLPERIEKQVKFLESHPEIDVVGCNRVIFDENGDRGIRKSIEYPTKDVLLKGSPFAHPTIMMKASVYKALGGYTVSQRTMRAEDIDLWIRFYNNNYVGYNLQEVLYRYRESVHDLKKRTLKAAIQTSRVYYYGYKILDIPWYKRGWRIKPIIAALIPNKLMEKYFNRKLE